MVEAIEFEGRKEGELCFLQKDVLRDSVSKMQLQQTVLERKGFSNIKG